jgi:hypothetical protein
MSWDLIALIIACWCGLVLWRIVVDHVEEQRAHEREKKKAAQDG